MARKVAAAHAARGKPDRGSGRRPPASRHAIVAVVLAAVAFATYANSFDAGFVLDNQEMIRQARLYHTSNTSVTEIVSHDYWWPNWISGAYRPLSTLSYSLNYSILGNGERPAGYHLINLLLHWGNAVLLYFVTLTLVGHVLAAFFTALLFTTHPIATEAVTNIVGRSDLLATASVLGGLLLYIRSHRRTDGRRLPWLAGVGLTTAAGCFCKETALVICPVIVLYDMTFRLERSGGQSIQAMARQLAGFAGRDWVVLIPPLLLFWGARAWVYHDVAPVPIYFTENHLIAADFLTARISALGVLGKSLWLLIWPQRLCWDYSVDATPVFQWTLRSWEDWQALVTVAALLCIAAVAFRSSKPMFFFISFGFMAILPTSNLILLIPSVMAERFLYLPLVGFAGCVGLMAYAAQRRLDRGHAPNDTWSWSKSAVWCVLGFVAVVYGIRTFSRNFDWRDDLSIRTSGVEVNPDSFRVHYVLAKTLYESDAANLDRAISEAETAQAILEASAPPSVSIPAYVLQDLGVYYEEKARATERTGGPAVERLSWRRKAADALERATAWYRIANEEHRQIELARGRRPEEIIDVGVASVYVQLGDVHQRLGQPQEAVAAYVHARHLAPRDADVHEALSIAYTALGRREDAIISLLQAYMFDQDRQSIWSQLLPLYETIDPGGCAFARVGDEFRFDDKCPIARRHICQAFQRQVEVYREAHLSTEAEELRQSAQRGYGCGA